MLIVGSRSGVDLGREIDYSETDWDYISTWKQYQTEAALPELEGSKYPINEGKTWVIKSEYNGIHEYEIAWPGSTGDSLLTLLDAREGRHAADANVIYTLKMSHRFLKNSPHFYKTMEDIRYLRANGATIFNEEWYQARIAETYHYEHPNLDRSKDEFFVDEYEYDHDDVHKVVAVWGAPAYESYKVPGEEVKCSRELFEALPVAVRLNGVYEEASVLSIERSLVPFADQNPDPVKVFRFALMKVCSSITSGWFREFAWENHDRVLELFEDELGGGQRLLECVKQLEKDK